MGKDVTMRIFQRVLDSGYDAINSRGMNLAHIRYDSMFKYYLKKFCKKAFKWQGTIKYDFEKVSKLLFTEEDKCNNVYPTIIPNWDRTPRNGKNAIVWYHNSPEYFKEEVKIALNMIKDKPKEHKILFLMSWNEWGEGNYMEPDIEFGKGYIKALREVIKE